MITTQRLRRRRLKKLLGEKHMVDVDIHARMAEFEAQTEIGTKLLDEIEREVAKFNAEMNEKRQAVARNLIAINGAMTLLREMGAVKGAAAVTATNAFVPQEP